MARSACLHLHLPLALLLSLSLVCTFTAASPRLAIGLLACEDLLPEDCAFSVSSSGARCVLEKIYSTNGKFKAQCQTALIAAEKAAEWIESDECIEACGLTRMTFGLSTDLLLEPDRLDRLCSPRCLDSCPNIVDLYTNLAAGEGIYLPQLCLVTDHQGRRSLVSIAPQAPPSGF